MIEVSELTTEQYIDFIQARLQKLVKAIDEQQNAVTELLSALEHWSNWLDEQADKLNG